MISKKELKNMVDTVCFHTNQTQEQLAIELGYGRTYISEMLTERGKVSDKFVGKMKLKYNEFLDNPKTGKVSEPEIKYGAQKKDQPLEVGDLRITLGDYINEITRTKAFLERMLDGGLKELRASLDEQAQLLSAVQSDLLAKSEVALNALAKIQNPKKPPKLNAEADKISQQRQGMRPHTDSGIDGKDA